MISLITLEGYDILKVKKNSKPLENFLPNKNQAAKI